MGSGNEQRSRKTNRQQDKAVVQPEIVLKSADGTTEEVDGQVHNETQRVGLATVGKDIKDLTQELKTELSTLKDKLKRELKEEIGALQQKLERKLTEHVNKLYMWKPR